ncbi:MAG: SDR family oxidoreductase [bacterium]|jgi:3-oxoacyl-[acyl-carrier protein] reductase
MNISLEGKKAIVCGSSQGIGKAIAVELANSGASCILLARDETRLKLAVSELPAGRLQQHGYFVVDFSDIDALKKVVSEICGNHDIDILVNNTGGPAAGLISSAEIKEFESAFQQHLICNHILTQAVVPGMRRKGWGRIINVISTSVRIPLDHLGVSNTIRAAVASWSKTMSNELAQYGITVNSLLPGFIATARLEAVARSFAQREQVTQQEMEERMKHSVPAKRFGSPSEIAAVAAFLSSPAASYVNGVAIPVDGGRTGTI